MNDDDVTCHLCEGYGWIKYPDPTTRVTVTQDCPACSDDYCPRDPGADRFETDPALDRRSLDG